MKIEAILSTALSNGMFPIRIEPATDDEEQAHLTFIGSIDDYWRALISLEVKAVFVTSMAFQEELFYGQIEDVDAIDEDEVENQDMALADEEGMVDFRLASDEMRKFEKYLGLDFAFSLRAAHPHHPLTLIVREDWWQEFNLLRDNAARIVRSNHESLSEKVRDQRSQREQSLIRTIRKLISDSDFVRIRTQRSMMVYALEKHPELEELDDRIRLREIQLLRDKMQAAR